MGIKKVNLNQLSSMLAPRGRDPYADAELLEALLDMLVDGEPFQWETAVIEGATDKAITASKAKWRNRAVSVFNSIDTDRKITVAFGTENELFILLKD